jgi:hypothetical protein
VTGFALALDPSQLANLVDRVTPLLAAGDVMLPTVGFSVGDATDYSKMWDFLDFIQDGGAGVYQQAVRSQVEALAPLDPSGNRIVYQLGNEIGQYTYSDAVRKWAAGRGIVIPGVAKDYDQDYIPYYVEYHLAPTVEAMLEASYNAYGDANVVSIALGSINNGGSAEGKAWLDLLLNYSVQGRYAPSLAGKKVYELVDLATVHYVGGTENIEPVWDAWNGVGSVRGLWTTEEIGHKAAEEGAGASRAIKTIADHLNWYYNKGLNKEQVRVGLYDWGLNGPVTGTSADTAMNVILDFFGAVPVEPRTDAVTLEVASGQADAYYFQSLNEDGKRVIVVTPSAKSGSTILSGISFEKLGWTGVVEGTLHAFSPLGHTVSPVTLLDEGSRYRIVLPGPVSLVDDKYSVLITLKLK